MNQQPELCQFPIDHWSQIIEQKIQTSKFRDYFVTSHEQNFIVESGNEKVKDERELEFVRELGTKDQIRVVLLNKLVPIDDDVQNQNNDLSTNQNTNISTNVDISTNTNIPVKTFSVYKKTTEKKRIQFFMLQSLIYNIYKTKMTQLLIPISAPMPELDKDQTLIINQGIEMLINNILIFLDEFTKHPFFKHLSFKQDHYLDDKGEMVSEPGMVKFVVDKKLLDKLKISAEQYTAQLEVQQTEVQKILLNYDQQLQFITELESREKENKVLKSSHFFPKKTTKSVLTDRKIIMRIAFLVFYCQARKLEMAETEVEKEVNKQDDLCLKETFIIQSIMSQLKQSVVGLLSSKILIIPEVQNFMMNSMLLVGESMAAGQGLLTQLTNGKNVNNVVDRAQEIIEPLKQELKKSIGKTQIQKFINIIPTLINIFIQARYFFCETLIGSSYRRANWLGRRQQEFYKHNVKDSKLNQDPEQLLFSSADSEKFFKQVRENVFRDDSDPQKQKLYVNYDRLTSYFENLSDTKFSRSLLPLVSGICKIVDEVCDKKESETKETSIGQVSSGNNCFNELIDKILSLTQYEYDPSKMLKKLNNKIIARIIQVFKILSSIEKKTILENCTDNKQDSISSLLMQFINHSDDFLTPLMNNVETWIMSKDVSTKIQQFADSLM